MQNLVQVYMATKQWSQAYNTETLYEVVLRRSKEVVQLYVSTTVVNTPEAHLDIGALKYNVLVELIFTQPPEAYST